MSENEKMQRRWQDVPPEEWQGLDLQEHPEITAPQNEMGEICPWPWDPQQRGGQPLGMYHCPYCGGMVIAGLAHTDWTGIDENTDWGPEPGTEEFEELWVKRPLPFPTAESP